MVENHFSFQKIVLTQYLKNDRILPFLLLVPPLVGQMKKPVGITVVGDGIALVDKRSLHLLNAVDGSHQRQLWTLPKDFDKADSLASLSADREVCVCSTKRGVVFVMDSVL